MLTGVFDYKDFVNKVTDPNRDIYCDTGSSVEKIAAASTLTADVQVVGITNDAG